MTIDEIELKFADAELATTFQLIYRGNENILIINNHYDEEKSENIEIKFSIPKVILKKFLDMLENV